MLYNDGRFDASSCSNYLYAYAEYWLLENVSSATDLFPKDNQYDDSKMQDSVNKDITIFSNSIQTNPSSTSLILLLSKIDCYE